MATDNSPLIFIFTMNNNPLISQQQIQQQVAAALKEDIQQQDLTASLIPQHAQAYAEIITRQAAVLCGQQWFEQCFLQQDKDCRITWQAEEGSPLSAGQTICRIQGNARALLSAERQALNFLQTLSAVASKTRLYVDTIHGTQAAILDTRKTLPGLRLAQKYAVLTGGGVNQRIGLFDGVLIKENHIAAAGGIQAVMQQAKNNTPDGISIQIEVETQEQLQQALSAGAQLILLDNFTPEQMRQAVALTHGRAQLEASGGITLESVRAIAETGVDRISIGSLTKDIQAIDLSMRIKQLE